MSLLQEALKRKEQDERNRQAEARAAASVLGQAAAPPADGQPPLEQPAGGEKAAPEEVAAMRLRLAAQPPAEQQPAAPVAGKPAGQEMIPPQSMPAPARDPVAGQPAAGQPLSGAPQRYRRTAARLWWAIGAVALILFMVIGLAGSIFVYRLFSGFKTNIARQITANVRAAAVATGEIEMAAGKIARPAIPAPPGAMPTSPPALSAAAPPAVSSPAESKAVALLGGPKVSPEQGVTAATGRPPAVVSLKAETAPLKPPPAKPKKVAPPAVKWPALKLTGVLRAQGKSESAAHINGKLVSVGQTIEGVTVVEIQADQVVLKCGAETKTLRVGTVLY